MASTLLRTPSPLQMLIPPSELRWPTSPASLRADNLLDQLHGVEAEEIETSLKSRRGRFDLIPYYDWHSALPVFLPSFPSASIPHSTSNPASSTSIASFPTTNSINPSSRPSSKLLCAPRTTLTLPRHFRVIAPRSFSSTTRIDVFDAGWAA
ncbi:uncharacterized protein LACBIDRAFT_299520 [Laccaria bicolor S238N-H82]|uniref:Predicted protein n=1 Tax=Laccaria bicolor (strain S238N-H82 / ATCC MYA-4686) TaxID=486041 RepID=B0E3Q4_LACBS|nr:uncharacterized protein LACBIDRAFT_299520 [Laccaria bicolor S238N-H82]EDQ98529.1 predicted protein [Laccaria bicolor S238N-H82]|eukprot:XP_001890823.1 predicted protein [Laccaria bicolor S238N-H82]